MSWEKLSEERAGEIADIVVVTEITWHLNGHPEPKDQFLRNHLMKIKSTISKRTAWFIMELIQTKDIVTRFENFFKVIQI
jgi:hypothetical protein